MRTQLRSEAVLTRSLPYVHQMVELPVVEFARIPEVRGILANPTTFIFSIGRFQPAVRLKGIEGRLADAESHAVNGNTRKPLCNYRSQESIAREVLRLRMRRKLLRRMLGAGAFSLE
jgi:hypothetical protein